MREGASEGERAREREKSETGENQSSWVEVFCCPGNLLIHFVLSVLRARKTTVEYE